MGDDDSTRTLGDDLPVRFGPRSASTAVLSGIERFTILKKLGEGGMGSVYAAYDSALDRRVAVKLVRADRRRSGGVVSPREQLLREAQAMARLSHPNVVAIHEVGEIGEDVFVVLELVDGMNLQEWLKESRPAWRQIIDAYVQAGRGLAAAHEAGLVHRDFKPSNVLIRRDGRIQVADFGVVSMGGGSSSDGPSGDADVPQAPSQITFVGRRVGTLAYMAPEQYAGAVVDGRADQYSFCVALWESLYGTRPFAGDGAKLAAAMSDGVVVSPPASAVPRWVEGALRRGLSPRAADRFPSMDELIHVLAHDPARARKRAIALGAGAVAVIALAISALVGWTRDTPTPTPCEGQDAPLARRWNTGRAAAVRDAFARSGVPYAAAASTRVVPQLDAWAAGWVAMRVDACRATRVTGEQSEALLDARMRCLDRQLDEVDQLASALVTTDRDVIARAAQSLALPDVTVCADRDEVLVRVPPPSSSSDRARVAQLEHELAGVRAAERTGRYKAARERATGVARDAIALGFQPLVAEALVIRGRLEELDGDVRAANETLAAAAHAAGTSRDDRTAASALLSLIEVHLTRGEAQAALAIGVAADAAVARTRDAKLEAALVEALGAAHAAAGDGQAGHFLQRALELREAAGRDTVEVAQVLNRLGGLAAGSGDNELARGHYQRALAIVQAQLGPAHPSTAITRANLCYLDALAGKLAEARACQEGVLATLEASLGADHAQVAWALNEVALSQREQGELDGAAARFERALAIWERASGPAHPDVAWPLINLGEIALERSVPARADELCGRALAIVERSSGPTHPDLIEALGCAARAKLAKAPADAVTLARRARQIAMAHGRPADVELDFVLVRALAATGAGDEARQTARGLLAAADGEVRTRIERWLRDHP